MKRIDRRQFGKLAGAAGILGVGTSAFGRFAIAQGTAKVVIVGGGAGGATVAHYVKKGAPDLDVTLIEANPIYCSSFFSNLYLGGFRTLDSLNHDYAGLKKLGVNVVQDYATDVDTTARTVRTRGGSDFSYDRLVLSPGMALNYESVEGYSREAAEVMPHAYTTDGAQKELLKSQLDAMDDGGTVLVLPPNNPFRCPPGPYERVCMIAHMLKTSKPKSKLVVLD